MLNSTPKEKASPCFQAPPSPASLINVITLSAMTGKTHGIIFKIIPPKKAKMIATKKERDSSLGLSILET